MLPDPAKFAAVCLAAYALAFADQDARKQTTPNQKQAVLQALDRINDRRPPLTSGRDAVATQQLLEKILMSAGLPTQEQQGRQHWHRQFPAPGSRVVRQGNRGPWQRVPLGDGDTAR